MAAAFMVPPTPHATQRALWHGCASQVTATAHAAPCAVGGSVGSGKSSLVAVLCHGAGGRPALDDGRGRARTSVLRHRHEIQSGHTSSISQCMLGYDGRGTVLNYSSVAAPTVAEISAAAHKVLHFIDLCGHSRFLKTALYGVAPALPARTAHGTCLPHALVISLGEQQRFHGL